MITFEFLNANKAPIDEGWIRIALQKAEEKLRKISRHVPGRDDERFVSIECVSKREIQHLNYKLRGHNQPTDIISISSQETEAGEQDIKIGREGELAFEINQTQPVNPLPALGQLVICWEVIAANAAQSGQSPEHELEWVIEHGVYHLMGFHHPDD